MFPNNSSGRYMASEYGKWAVHNLNTIAAGSASMTLDNCYVSVGTGNKKIFPFATNVPVTIIDGSLTETALAETAISAPAGASAGPNPYTCSFTATFANAHNAGVTNRLTRVFQTFMLLSCPLRLVRVSESTRV